MTLTLADLWENKNAKYVWYMCPHCDQPSTLAYGECNSCKGTLTPETFEGAEALFPNVEVEIESPSRLAYILLHRSWICTSCSSYNINYPRGAENTDGLACLNCRDEYIEWTDILLEDGDTEMSESAAIESFSEYVNHIILDHANWTSEEDILDDYVEPTYSESTYHNYNESEYHRGWRVHSMFSALQRNSFKVFSSVFWTAGLWFLAHYWFIEDVDKYVSIAHVVWEKLAGIHIRYKHEQERWQTLLNV